jgi:hypothetical protein
MLIFEISFTETTIRSNIEFPIQCNNVVIILHCVNYNYYDILWKELV